MDHVVNWAAFITRGCETAGGQIITRAIYGALLCAFTAVAVEPGLPSKTAIVAATLRGIGTKNPDPELRNPD
jgi:hypothetical protein